MKFFLLLFTYRSFGQLLKFQVIDQNWDTLIEEYWLIVYLYNLVLEFPEWKCVKSYFDTLIKDSHCPKAIKSEQAKLLLFPEFIEIRDW